MSLHDPARRPWGSDKGARRLAWAAWILVAAAALLAALWWVRMLLGDDDLLTASIIAFNVSVFGGVGALLLDLLLIDRGDEGDGAALVRMPGSWLTGAGLGAVAAAALAPGTAIVPLFWGALMLAAGVLLLLSPVLLQRYRDRRAERHQRIRTTGVRTTATVTRVRTFYRDHYAVYRVTLRFRDENGDQRWFTQTAARGARSVTEGMTLPLSYDPADPGSKRALVVEWPMWNP